MRGIHNRLALIAAMSLVASSAVYGGQEVQRAPDPEPPKPKPPLDTIATAHADPGQRFVPFQGSRRMSRKKRKELRAKGKL